MCKRTVNGHQNLKNKEKKENRVVNTWTRLDHAPTGYMNNSIGQKCKVLASIITTKSKILDTNKMVF